MMFYPNDNQCAKVQQKRNEMGKYQYSKKSKTDNFTSK